MYSANQSVVPPIEWHQGAANEIRYQLDPSQLNDSVAWVPAELKPALLTVRAVILGRNIVLAWHV